MKHYVVGLVFNAQADKVVLTCKDRPEKLAGKINGIGGKFEPGENMYMAMSRETQQETSIILPLHAWHKFAELADGNSMVHVLRAFTPLARTARQQPGESEKIYIWRPDDIRIAARGLADMPQLIHHARTAANSSILRLGTSVSLAA